MWAKFPLIAHTSFCNARSPLLSRSATFRSRSTIFFFMPRSRSPDFQPVPLRFPLHWHALVSTRTTKDCIQIITQHSVIMLPFWRPRSPHFRKSSSKFGSPHGTTKNFVQQATNRLILCKPSSIHALLCCISFWLFMYFAQIDIRMAVGNIASGWLTCEHFKIRWENKWKL